MRVLCCVIFIIVLSGCANTPEGRLNESFAQSSRERSQDLGMRQGTPENIDATKKANHTADRFHSQARNRGTNFFSTMFNTFINSIIDKKLSTKT